MTNVENWLITEIAALGDADPEKLDTRTAFNRYLDSNSATTLTSRLAKHLGRVLPPTLFWDYPSIEKLSAYLNGGESKSNEPTTFGRETSTHAGEPIAIIGMACRFPGGANDPHQYWENLLKGTDAVHEMPADRRNAASQNSRAADDSPPGGYLDDVFSFDNSFFRIKPSEALHMDPQQRLMLELAWEGLEDAGLPASSVRGQSVGVFMGAMWNEYHRHQNDLTAHSATGGDGSIISARIAYFLGLQGPALTINTACSSSLVAVHTAMQSLRSGEIQTALAGGVSLILSEYSRRAMSSFGALSPKYRCAAFDAEADGYVRGEGAGLLVLKPLSRAIRDGNTVYCVIRGSAVNNDGASNGLTAPSGEAQAQAIRGALAAAELTPEKIQYIETHGTGTRLGDPIEAAALGSVYGAMPRPDVRIGSVKTNLGHLEAAAGMAGLLKTALALHHRRLPPSLHFRNPNPHIDFRTLRLRVQDELSPWPESEHPPAAGVSSFGFGGTNAHMILQAHPPTHGSVRPPWQPAKPAQDTAFIFSGGGHQWQGMARELLVAEPAFRARLTRCDTIVSRLGNWSLLEELLSGENLHRTDIVQPVLAAVQLGLADVHSAYGILPGAVLGHSGGEPAAACFAGVLSEEQAMEVAFHRGRLQAQAGGLGGMVYATMEMGSAERIIGEVPGTTIAAVNGPRSLVFSGANETLEELITRLNEVGADPRRVRVDFAAHGPAMEELKEEFFAALQGLRPTPGDIPLYSPLDGRKLPGLQWDAYYWARNLREQVRFDLGIRALQEQGVNSFIEISAHPILARAVQEFDETFTILPSLKRGKSDLLCMEECRNTWFARNNSRTASTKTADAIPVQPPVHLFTLSAADWEGLRAKANKTLEFIRNENPDLRDLCFTHAVHREHLDHRWAGGVSTSTELQTKLSQFLNLPGKSDRTDLFRKKPRLALVFSGQGSEWPGMGLELFRREAAFRRSMRSCDEIFQSISGWSLLSKLEDRPGEKALTNTAEVQAGIFAIQVSLYELLRERGVTPDAVVGHSVGEIAAAHVAGILSIEDALRLVYHRGKMMSRPEFRGRMLEAEISEEQAKHVLSFMEGRVCIAARNSPDTMVFSGDSRAMRDFRSRLRRLNVRTRLLRTRYAFHGPRMSDLRENLSRKTAFIKPQPGQIKFYSTVTTNTMSGLDLHADYWGRNAAEPVLFARTIDMVMESGCKILLEVSPRAVLAHSMNSVANGRGDSMLIAPLARKSQSQVTAFTECMARLYCAGYPLNFPAFFPRGGALVRGSTYPWRKKQYQLEIQPPWPGSRPALANTSGPAFYQVNWQPRSSNHADLNRTNSQRPWILFRDASGVAGELHTLLRAAGERVTLIEPNAMDRFEAALSTEPSPYVLYPWNQRGTANGSHSLYDAPELLNILRRLGAGKKADLWILTADLPEPYQGRAEFADPMQSALWGLGRTVALEVSERRTRMADLTRACVQADSPLFRERAGRLLEVIRNPGSDEQFLIGARNIHIPILVHADPPPRETVRFRRDGAYLITGGAGGMGRLLAEKLLERGAGRVVLASRRKPDTPLPVDERIEFIPCDVTVVEQVRNLIQSCGENLRGIFHAAGANMDQQDSAKISEKDWRTTAHSKIQGVLNLHEATQKLPLDYFACFSSAASVWGASGMIVYAAANAFLDGFMEKRRQAGLPGLTTNFGPLRNVGMARQEFPADGVLGIDAHRGLESFLQLLSADMTHRTIAHLEPQKFGDLMRSRGRGSFVARISSSNSDAPTYSTTSVDQAGPLEDQLAKLPPLEREEFLVSFLRKLVQAMTGAMEGSIPLERGFFQIGMDSLMAVELRNRLQGQFSGPLSPTLLLEYPNVRLLAEYLLTRFAPDRTQESQGRTEPSTGELEPGDIPDVITEAARLTDREILSTLRSK